MRYSNILSAIGTSAPTHHHLFGAFVGSLLAKIAEEEGKALPKSEQKTDFGYADLLLDEGLSGIPGPLQVDVKFLPVFSWRDIEAQAGRAALLIRGPAHHRIADAAARQNDPSLEVEGRPRERHPRDSLTQHDCRPGVRAPGSSSGSPGDRDGRAGHRGRDLRCTRRGTREKAEGTKSKQLRGRNHRPLLS
jgi:hypothetical protein